MLSRILSCLLLSLLACSHLIAQEVTGLQADIRAMGKETDPSAMKALRDRIIAQYKLDSLKDAKVLDLLHGQVAIAYVRKGNLPEFKRNIARIRNPFNQTSMLSMAATELLREGGKEAQAAALAKETIDRYLAFKDDPSARPSAFSPEDWKRFMQFAQYPYYDTYVHALFAQEKWEEALRYQQLAFDGAPEDGMPASAERYARLLQRNGRGEEAHDLLLKLAAKGKLTKGMIDQLKSDYTAQRGSTGFAAYLDSLQTGVRAELVKSLRREMLQGTAPAFTLKDLSGQSVSLSDFRGKVVVLDLWATWCVPCIASFPAMQLLVEKHPDVVFLFIAVDERGADPLARVKAFMEKRKYSFRVLMDQPEGEGSDRFVITSAYKPDGIPAKYFIDRQGGLRFTSKGFDTDAALVNEVEAIITILNTL